MSQPEDVPKDAYTEAVEQFLEWNDRIFERFFPVSPSQPLRILSFDAGELRALAAEMDQPIDAFRAATGALIERGSGDPFTWWSLSSRLLMSDRDPPCYVGLLAMFSLAASESGDAIVGHPRAFFHRQLAHLLGLEETEYVRGFANATEFYRVLQDYLRVQCGGRRGSLLVTNTSFGGKYVWRARVQVLLNASSRRQLAFYFDHRCAHRGELRKNELRAMLLDELARPRDYVLSPSLRSTLELVRSEGNELLDGFVDLVETEYVRWFLSRGEEAARPVDPRESKTVGAANAIVDAVRRQSMARIGRPARVVYEKRLTLRSRVGGLAWQVCVQARSTGTDWQDALSGHLSWGTGSITYQLSDGTVASLAVDDPSTFANDGDGWAATPQLRAGNLCAVLCSRTDAGELKAAFAELPGAAPVIRDCADAPDAAIVTALVPRATTEQIPPSLRPLLVGDEARISFRRGLRVGDKYFETAPPRVVYDHPTILSTSVFLDGRVLATPISRRVEYPLPGSISTGVHAVNVLGVCRSFHVANKAVASEMDPYDCEGFEICHARGVALPVKAPGGTRSGEYDNAKAVIVVGALLL